MVAAKRSELEAAFASRGLAIRGVLLHGADRGVVHELADQLARRRVTDLEDPFCVSRLSGGDIENDPARLGDDLSALSMTGEPRLVRVRLGPEKPATERAVAEAVTAHLHDAFNPAALLLIESEPLDKTSVLRKAAEAAAGFLSVAIYADEPGDVTRLVREVLARDRLTLEPAALDVFVGRMPQSRGVVRAETERLAMFIGPGRRGAVAADELDDFLGVEPEATLFTAAHHAFGGRLRDAHANWRRARAEGEDGAALVRALSTHASRLRRAQAMIAAGRTAQEATKLCRIFWKEEREFVRQLKVWKMTELDAVQPELHDADRASKTTGSPAELLAERLLLSIAVRARRSAP